VAKRKQSGPTDEVLSHVNPGRREALKRILAGGAFIAPALISLPLAYASPAEAQTHPPHPTPTPHPWPTPKPRS
jgi:hypothetical protein